MVLLIQIPADDMVAKILEQSGLSQEELDRKIRQKMDQLAGLISKEGALHILANETGVKLYENTSGRLKVQSLLAGMRSIELLVKVVDVYEVREFETNNRKGKVGSFLAADETGKTRIVLWGAQADKLSAFSSGDIILIKDAYVKDNQGRKEVHVGERASLTHNPAGETVNVSAQQAASTRKPIAQLQDNDRDVEILGTIVQVYNLNFFDVCSQCNRRARPQEEKYMCEQHGAVTPDTSYVLNLILDDGSGNIRTVFFRNQVTELMEKSKEELIAFRPAPEDFEQIKHELLGKMIKIVGRTTMNMMFNRLELTAQRVYPNPNPEEELKRLGGEVPKEKSPAGPIQPVQAPAKQPVSLEEQQSTSTPIQPTPAEQPSSPVDQPVEAPPSMQPAESVPESISEPAEPEVVSVETPAEPASTDTREDTEKSLQEESDKPISLDDIPPVDTSKDRSQEHP